MSENQWQCSRDPTHIKVPNVRNTAWYCHKCLSAAGKRGADVVHRDKRARLLARISISKKATFDHVRETGE